MALNTPLCLGLDKPASDHHISKSQCMMHECHIVLKRFCKMLDKGIFAYVGSTIANVLYSQISSLYVATYLLKEQAALYFSALTISSIIWLLVNAQAQKMLPELINTSIYEIKTIIKRDLIFILSITGGVFIFMVLFGKILLQLLYGKIYYVEAYPILLILMFGNICVSEAGVFGVYITASGNQKQKIPMQLEASAITIISLFTLHNSGIYGAAISYLLAAIYTGFRYTTFTLKLIKEQNIKENTWNSKI